MVLKSYRLKFKKGKKKKSKDIGRVLVAGTTALIGTAFVTQIAGVLGKL